MHVDVLIAGAGLSGIDAAVHLSRAFPGRSYAVLEQRAELGGTWSLFRYPGVRADSDMFTLGFPWKPWRGDRAIAEGADILAYLDEAAREHGVHEHIRYRHKVVHLAWSSAARRWTVTVLHTDTGQTSELTCDFFVAATGYYDTERGHQPEFAGMDQFAGELVHPQNWPVGLDLAGRSVLVIGSGATAVTLVPAIAREARQVTLVQRSPTYVRTRARLHPAARLARRFLPRALAHAVLREAHAASAAAEYALLRRLPRLGRRLLRTTGGDPAYNPWDQRLCVAPDADLWRSGAEVVTDDIERFTEKGVRLVSGRELDADVVVMATGLSVLGLGGATMSLDGDRRRFGAQFAYKAMMLADVPNFLFLLGYANASWTLKVDLACEYLVRLLRHMDAAGHSVVVPRLREEMQRRPLTTLTSGYLMRSGGQMPWAGDRDPWRLRQNWYADRRMIRRDPLDDGVLEFS